MGLTLGYTETRNNYNKSHPNPNNIGIIGATPSQWGKFLKNKNIPINSIRAGIAIYKEYLKDCNGNQLCALKKYKGSTTDKTTHLATKVLNAYNQILVLEKQRDPEAFGVKPKKGKK